MLQLDADSCTYRFGYSGGEHEEATSIGSGEVHYLSTEVGGKFTGTYIVLYATGNGKKSRTPACFDWFEYRPIAKLSTR